jgi:hypothetical protein
MGYEELFRHTMELLSTKYEVKDILLPTSDCIFLLESPHVQELKFGAPVSGTSGQTMTRHLFGEEFSKFPLGRLVKKNADEHLNRPRLNRIGLVNVCNIPMQSSAYAPADRQPYQQWLRAMEQVRTANHKDDLHDDLLNAVQSTLVASLRHKLQPLQDCPAFIIPCGRFAQKFFRLAQVSSANWTVIDGVPHPSYNSWDKPRYREVVAQVQRALSTPVHSIHGSELSGA